MAAYSALGAAALATTASAQIVNVTAFAGGDGSQNLNQPNEQFSIAVGGGFAAFTIRAFTASNNTDFRDFFLRAATGNLIKRVGLGNGNAMKLPAGAGVKGGDFGQLQRVALTMQTYNGNAQVSSFVLGSFVPGFAGNAAATGYIGFQHSNGANKYYGWLRIQVLRGADRRLKTFQVVPINGTNIFGAYNSVPGGDILAGATATAIPEPASLATGLALFALGAAGVREHRRRKQAA